jgi:hypothetical protein
LEGKLEVSRFGEFTSVSALESVLSWGSGGDTKIEAVSSTETFSDHGSLMDSKWIVFILRGGSVLS